MKALPIFTAAVLSLAIVLPASAGEIGHAAAAKTVPAGQSASVASSDGGTTARLRGDDHEIEMDVHVGK